MKILLSCFLLFTLTINAAFAKVFYSAPIKIKTTFTSVMNNNTKTIGKVVGKVVFSDTGTYCKAFMKDKTVDCHAVGLLYDEEGFLGDVVTAFYLPISYLQTLVPALDAELIVQTQLHPVNDFDKEWAQVAHGTWRNGFFAKHYFHRTIPIPAHIPTAESVSYHINVTLGDVDRI